MQWDCLLFSPQHKGHRKAEGSSKTVQSSRAQAAQSVDTRWNSVFYMLQRLSEQNEAVTTSLCLLGRSDLCLSVEELSVINQTIDVLRPFEEVTEEVSSEK